MDSQLKPTMDFIIKNVKTPLLIKGTLRWELLKWDTDKWKEILSKEKLVFRHGKNVFTPKPQFENTTEIVKMSFEEFLNVQNGTEWYYFDYKYLKDWLINCEELRKHISWSEFGFPEMSVEDSTIWIGSKGAHTPCHVDSYGCNIIAQIYGRKRWMLFPPEEDLQATRIPYEESSIFSRINFFAPSITDFKDIKNCYSVILNPGDVLVVPYKWWHYVENLEFAISINAWIKLPGDYKERVKEAIVRTTFLPYLKGLHPNIEKELLITNEETNKVDETSIESVDLLLECLQQYQDYKSITQHDDVHLLDIEKVLQTYQNIEVIQRLSKKELVKLLEYQSNRFTIQTKNEAGSFNSLTDGLSDFKRVIDAFVHNDVVELICKKLCKE